MRKILFILLIVSGSGIANSFPPLTSFYEIYSSGGSYNNMTIEVSGFLSIVDDDGIYLCKAMENCFTKSKERLRIESSGAFFGNINDYDMCHVSLTGKYLNDDNNDVYRTVGSLVNIQAVYMGVVRHDYHKINSSCSIWNEYYKNVLGEGEPEKIKRFYKRKLNNN